MRGGRCLRKQRPNHHLSLPRAWGIGPSGLDASRGRRYTRRPFKPAGPAPFPVNFGSQQVRIVRRTEHRRAPRARPVRGRPAIWTLALIAGVLMQTACVQRRLTIRSNPPGALVYIDNYEIGVTPVATDFIYYGSREIRLVKDGYETQTRMTKISAPWYQYVPIDFVAENVIPYEIRDERTIDFQLVPQMIVPTEELLGRADELRIGNRGGDFAPLPIGTSLPAPTGAEVIPPGEPAPLSPEFRFPQ